MKSGHTTSAVQYDAPGTARCEVELLLCCARTHLSPSAASRIKARLQESIDWDRLRLMALAQGVGPLLYRSLRQTPPETVPGPVLEELRSYVRSNVRRNLLLTGRLLRLLPAFKDRGIRAIPFKGPLIAVQVYGDLTLRPFTDIDVLVHERDAAGAKALLTAHGYQQRMSHPWEAPFEDESGVSVDLHWGIGPSYDPTPQTFEQLWTRVLPVSLAGVEVPTLAPEDLLLILSIQIAKDWRESRQRLLQICDTAELLRRHPNLDWKQVLGLARAAGGERILQLDLLLAHDLLGAPLPEAVLRATQGSRVARTLAREFKAQMFPVAAAAELRFTDSGLPRDKPVFYARTRERLRDKLRYFGLRARDRIGLVVHPSRSDREFLPLPAWLGFLYYFVRPVRVLSRRIRSGRIASKSERGSAAPS
jgi:hypothetical protein